MPRAIERLLEHLHDGASTAPSTGELTHWLGESRRFRSFVELNRDKIRKKLRGAAGAEAHRDVRAELRVAHLLLVDRRIELAFEAYGSSRGGPDFTVTFRGERSFNLEVTRRHTGSGTTGAARTLLGKLRQLPPSAANVVLLAVEGDEADALDVSAAIRMLQARAKAKDEQFFLDRGFDGTRGFHRRYQRLGEVLAWRETADGDGQTTRWTNASARIAVPERAVRACIACLRAVAPRDTKSERDRPPPSPVAPDETGDV